MAKTFTLDAGGIYYRQLNEQIREAVANGATHIVLNNVNGQRYIADAMQTKFEAPTKIDALKKTLEATQLPGLVVQQLGKTDDNEFLIRTSIGDTVTSASVQKTVSDAFAKDMERTSTSSASRVSSSTGPSRLSVLASSRWPTSSARPRRSVMVGCNARDLSHVAKASVSRSTMERALTASCWRADMFSSTTSFRSSMS